MGLLSHISNNSGTVKDNVIKSDIKPGSSGLLAKVLKNSNKTHDSFQDWARSNNFEHCGLFSLVHGMMVINHAYGMDCQTIASSVSSKDFWDGTLKNKDAVINYSKKDQDFYNFLQFFSFDLKNNITHISFLKIEETNSILMVYNIDSDKQINLTSSVKDNIPAVNKYIKNDYSSSKELIDSTLCVRSRLLSVDIINSIKSSIQSIQLPEAQITNVVLNCVAEEIFDMLSRAFPAPNITSIKKDSKINIYYNDKSHLDELLLQTHINLLLSETLCNPQVKPVLLNHGSPENCDEVVIFLGN